MSLTNLTNMKKFIDLKKEIMRQKKLIDLGEQINYDFGNWCAEDILDEVVLKYFVVKDKKSYNFVSGNNKLKALCEIMQ